MLVPLYRVGVIGLGRGRSVAEVLRQFDQFKLVAACDLSEARREKAQADWGLEATYAEVSEFLAHDLNVVIVASPPEFHAEHSIQALKAGRNALCEVPLVYSLDTGKALEQAKALIAAVREAKRASRAKLMFAENTNYWAFVQDWRERIRAGQLGKLTYAEAEYVHDCRSIMRNADGSLTWRGLMPPIYYCTHSLGPVFSLFGERGVRVVGTSTGSRLAPEIPAPDMEAAFITTESGAVIKLLCGFKVARSPAHHWFSLYGTGGSIEMVRNQARAVAHFAEGEPKGMQEVPFSFNYPDAPPNATAGGHGTCEYYMVSDFLRTLNGERTNPIDVFDGLKMTLPGIIAHASAMAGGVPMEIPNPDEF